MPYRVLNFTKTRRRFYLTFIYSMGAVITGALSVPAFVYLFFPPKTAKASEWVDATDISKLTDNTPEEVVFRRNRVDGWKVTSEKSTASGSPKGTRAGDSIFAAVHASGMRVSLV